jgi:hypothetical protein
MFNMKLSLIAITAALFLPFFSSAQSNYKPGYIVDLKGDTLKGNIDYREWEKNPKQVSFKSSARAVTVYTPQNAKAFSVDGLEYYEQHTVKVSLDRIDATIAGGVVDSSYRMDTVFLKTLTRGRYLSLYSYADDIKPRFYVLWQVGAVPAELVFHIYVDANSVVHDVNGYRLQLKSIAQNNNVSDDKLAGLLSRSEYKERDLLKIAAAINGNDPAQFVTKSQLGTRAFAGAGINYNDMAFNGNIAFSDNYTLSPKISGGIDLLTNKNTQQLVLRLEISLTRDQHNFNDAYQQSQLKVTQNTASVIPQVYYSIYNGQKLKIFAGGGIAVNFSSYPNRYYQTLGGNNNEALIKQPDFPDYHTIWESLIIRAGVILNKKVEVYAGYSPASAVTDNYAFFEGNVTSYQAGVNFLFGAK